MKNPTPKSYTLEFTLAGLPKMSNQLLRGHWRAKHGHAKTWKRKVWAECWHRRPSEPLEKAKLTLVRVSSAEPDTDGLISSFKHIVDGLVECGVLANDKPSNIGIPDYRWERGPRGAGCVRVKVEQVTKEQSK